MDAKYVAPDGTARSRYTTLVKARELVYMLMAFRQGLLNISENKLNRKYPDATELQPDDFTMDTKLPFLKADS